MPIHINLLAEDQAAEEQRRRDPFKRSIWIGGFVVFLVLLWGLSLFLRSTIARIELASHEARWKSIEKTVKQIEADRRRTVEIQRRLSALAQFTTNRFLWANALDTLQRTGVDNIQMIRLKAEQSYHAAEPGRLPTNLVATVARTTGAVERIVLHLDGRDFSPRAAEQVPRFKEALAGTPFFQAHLQKTNSLLLTSLSAPQAEAQKAGAYVVFGLQLNFQDKECRLHE